LIEEVPATIARLCTELLTIEGRSDAGKRRTHEESTVSDRQILAFCRI
jgi:hypothetical protein